jgi:Xaa-Pro aminopeptidase
VPKSIYAARRQRFLDSMGPGVAVFPATPVAMRNNDVEHEYRADSDLFYLTGFDEPECVLVLAPQHAQHRVVLFVRPRDPAREVWDGARAGVEGAVAQFGADAAFPISELGEKLPDYVANTRRLFYRAGRDRSFDDRVFATLNALRAKQRLGVGTPSELIDPGSILHEQRLRKDERELGSMRHAIEATRAAFEQAMLTARPGGFEYEVEAELLHAFRAHGCERFAYGPIVGSGPNATTLHYRKNDRRMEDGELLLIDAGAEHEYYAADVTRTFPVSGTFTKPQRIVYDLVLAAQEAAIAAVRPGATLDASHAAAVRVLATGLLEHGLLKGTLEEVLEQELYKPFYMHRTSHWLGMDVHDVGLYFVDGKARPLEPGFVLTVEPGLYISATAEVAPEWRGIGVRIEDDLLVTADGAENLTAAIPKRADELERLLATRG